MFITCNKRLILLISLHTGNALFIVAHYLLLFIAVIKLAVYCIALCIVPHSFYRSSVNEDEYKWVREMSG